MKCCGHRTRVVAAVSEQTSAQNADQTPDEAILAEAESRRSGRVGLWVVLAVLGVATLLAAGLALNYSRFLSYVKHTIEDPENPPIWQQQAMSPEDCVDSALRWAANCRGVKALCDEYVTRVTTECLETRDHVAYCAAVSDEIDGPSFGVAECRARGVRRNIDHEACANAYKAVDSWCRMLRGDEMDYSG